MLKEFYGAFAGLCFTLLGLWWGVVQVRQNNDRWLDDPVRKRTAYTVLLSFLLPGTMGLFALIADDNPIFWRLGFLAAGLVGAVEMITLQRRTLPAKGGYTLTRIAIVLYCAIAAVALLAFTPIFSLMDLRPIQLEATLAAVLVILGVNLAWQVLMEEL